MGAVENLGALYGAHASLPSGWKGFTAVGAGEQRHRVHRLRPGVLLDLDRGQRAVGDPRRGVGGAHAVERLAADPAGRLEALDLHRTAAAMAGALSHGDDVLDAP